MPEDEKEGGREGGRVLCKICATMPEEEGEEGGREGFVMQFISTPLQRATKRSPFTSFSPFYPSCPSFAPPILTCLGREDSSKVKSNAQQNVIGEDGGPQGLGGELEKEGTHADGVIEEEEDEDGEA